MLGALVGSYGGVCVCVRGYGCCCVSACVARGCEVSACVRACMSACVFECVCVHVCGVRLFVSVVDLCVCVACVITRVCSCTFVCWTWRGCVAGAAALMGGCGWACVCAHAECWSAARAAVVVMVVCSWCAQSVCVCVFVCPSRLAFVCEWYVGVAVRLDRRRLCVLGCSCVLVGLCEHVCWCVFARARVFSDGGVCVACVRHWLSAGGSVGCA